MRRGAGELPQQRVWRSTTLVRAWLALVILVALVLVAGTAYAQSASEAPVEVTADHLEYEAERSLFIAYGNVRIVNGARSIEADWVVVGRDSEQGVAQGNVVYRDGAEQLFSEFLQFDTKSLQGLIYQAHLDTGKDGFLVAADQLIRRGEKEYTVRAGTFTTCRCPEGEAEPWRIGATEANVKIGGYATTQNTTFDVLGVPVMWLPWFVFPVKTERESGVLFPVFGFRGTGGFEVGLPLFWSARKNLNVIATPTYLTERGFKQNLELEYVTGEKSKGELFIAYGRDEKRADALPSGGAEGDEYLVNRWTMLLEHDQWLPGGWRAKADLNLISDNEYVNDFNELLVFRDDPYLDSKVFAFRQFGDDGRTGVVGSAIFTNDLQAVDSRDRDAVVHQQLPSLRAEVLSGESALLDGVVTRFEFDYAHFYSDRLPQNKFGIDGTGDDLFLDVGVDGRPPEPGFDRVAGEDNGLFNEGEPLADRGQRFVFHPRVAYPMRAFDLLEIYPEVGYRETLYTTHAQDFAQQGHITARVDLRTRLIGRPLGENLSHVLEPFAGWSMVSHASGSGNPLLIPAAALPQFRFRQFERDNLLADPSDRVNRRHTFTAGVSNRVYGRNRMLGSIDLSIDYHDMGAGTKYSVTQNDKNFSRFVVAGHTKRLYRTTTVFNLTFDPKDEQIEEGLFSMAITPFTGVSLLAGYRYRAPIPASTARYYSQISDDNPWDKKTKALSQLRPGAVLDLGQNLRIKYGALYDFEENRLIRHNGSVEYRSNCKCWGIGVDLSNRPGEKMYIGLRYSLLGSGDNSLRANAFANTAAVSKY